VDALLVGAGRVPNVEGLNLAAAGVRYERKEGVWVNDRLLAVWGKNDPFFLPRGAKAFKRDIPGAVVRFFDTGHFALETHAAEIAAAIREFLPR
jgi:pimeloyl-ACP methyl ester carboxylesterase